ncbi:DUF4112 domain-containing protein [Sphingomonas rubra]|uniref:DUF4112 domain-containing protein n=1 Tax=Sphingomonas rubra TaxID=634430 RepID=A0A1I5PJX2_9SPHN|nr:DUF4112 domain-containing protein [Sphingomonas rubra]SFP34147.1 protein of unknown function [Sphingomonas rubra]
MNQRTARIDPRLFDRLPIGRDPAAVRARVEALEKLLERSFVVPGINRPVGLDAIIGLIPVVGDGIAALMGSWLVWEARNLGLSRWQITRMMGNVGFDALLGLVPFIGDAADLLFRSNTRNLRIIRRHLDRHHPGTVTLEPGSR